jgi:hypothetical protein
VTERDHAILPAADEPENDDEIDVTPAASGDAPADVADESDAATTAGESVFDGDDVSDEPVPEPADVQWAEASGAVVLGVLGPEEMTAAGQAIARSRLLQNEIAALLPVADILLSLYQTQPTPTAPANTTTAAVVADRPAPERASSVTSRRVDRPRREVAERSVKAGFGGLTASTVLIGVLALAAAIGVLWALALSDKIATRDNEIAALKRQVTEFRQAANASTFVLSPSEDAGENAAGTVFYSIADSKVLIDVTGLAELDEDRVYQVWFQRNGSEIWEPGPTFLVNEDGESVQRLPGETPMFLRIAISEEPAPGSSEPTGSFLLEGALAGANG